MRIRLEVTMKKTAIHIKLYLLAATLLVLPVWNVRAQEEIPPQQEYLNTPIERRAFSEEEWKKAVKGLDYKETIPKQRKPRNTPSFGPGLVKIMFILMAAAAIALLLYFFGNMRVAPANRKLNRSLEGGIDVRRIEEHLQEADFGDLVKEATQQGDFALALRLYFLWTLQSLSRNKLINWRKEKTNRDYIREVKTTEFYEPLQQATQAYEEIWYGQRPLPAPDFERLAPQFVSLIQAVDRNASKPAES